MIKSLATLLLLAASCSAYGQKYARLPGYEMFDKIGGYDAGAVVFITRKKMSSPMFEFGNQGLDIRNSENPLPYFTSGFSRLRRSHKGFEILSITYKAWQGRERSIVGGTASVGTLITKLSDQSLEGLSYASRLFRKPQILVEVYQFDSALYNVRFARSPDPGALQNENAFPPADFGKKFDGEQLQIGYRGQYIGYRAHKLSKTDYNKLKSVLYRTREYESFSTSAGIAGLAMTNKAKDFEVRTQPVFIGGINLDLRTSGYKIFGISGRYFNYTLTTTSSFDTFRKEFKGSVDNSFNLQGFQGLAKFYFWNLDSPFRMYAAGAFTQSYQKLKSVQSPLLDAREKDIIIQAGNGRTRVKSFGGGLGFDYIIGANAGFDPTQKRHTLSFEVLSYQTSITQYSYTFNPYGTASVDRDTMNTIALQALLTYSFKFGKW